MKRLLVSGYRSYELNIFNKDDPRYQFLKEFIESKLIEYIYDGVEWFIITGNLGIEMWVGEIIIELKNEYPEISLALILPYTSFEQNWNENNQIEFKYLVENADYVDYTSKTDYESPSQLKMNQVFVIKNTDAAFLIYDTLTEESSNTKTKYLYELIQLYMESNEYELNLATFDEIDFFIHDQNDFL